MRRVGLVVIVWFGCGGGKPPATEAHPTLEVAPLDAPHDDASDEVTAVARQLAPLTASAQKPTIPAELRNVHLYVRDLEGLLLFDDEQAVATAELAAWGQAAGLNVEEPSRTRELIGHAKRGENAVTGKACGAALAPALAVTRWRTELRARGRLEARIRCAPECSLFITAAIGLDPSESGASAFFVAPYDVTRPWRSELPRAFTQLADAHDAQTPARGSTEPGSPADPASDAPFAPALVGSELRDRVRHCLGAGASVGVIVELDRDGKVTRCEGEDHHTIGDLPAAPCVCQDLAGQTFSDAKGRRRGTATFAGGPGTTTTKRGVRVHASLVATGATEPAIAGWAPATLIPVEQCFATESDPKPVETDVTIDFDANGAATKAALSTAHPLQKCIVAALSTLRAPCPLAPTAAHGRLYISFEKKPS
jgi:hypothetical protein